MVVLTFSVLDRKQPKIKQLQFRLIFGTYTNSNMQNSMVVFKFSVLGSKHPFLNKFDPSRKNCLFKIKLCS